VETTAEVGVAGSLGLKVNRGGVVVEEALDQTLLDVPPLRPLSVAEIVHYGCPRPDLPEHVNRWRRSNLPHLWRGARRVVGCKVLRAAHVYGQLYLRRFRPDGTIDELGLASLRVVTDTGVGYIVDAFQNLVELENMKFHGFGTGSTAESASQTALVTELTTEYVSDNVRPTGTTTEGATANIYRTVATLDPDADVALREHGIFSQAATGGGVMLDRSLYAAINLTGATGDTLQATYDLTFTSGS
jgi:hypothetical protein